MNFDWSDLAFSSKQSVRALDAIFIAAPRAMSDVRLKQLAKQYLPSANLIIGISKDSYVDGLENQPAFAMLTQEMVAPLQTKLASKQAARNVYTLTYFQRELPYILEKINFKRVIFINGSWFHAFHLHPWFYTLHKHGIPYERVSPFSSEAEAKAYAARHEPPETPTPTGLLTAENMLGLATDVAHNSFDSGGFQIGVALGKPATDGYRCIATAFNKVVPYQTYAMHHGAAREDHYAPMHDLNYYDTNHAEVELIIQAATKKLDLTGTTLFINVLPCPTCARMFTSTDIAHFVYRNDHSDGYAIHMLQAAGKTVTRLA